MRPLLLIIIGVALKSFAAVAIHSSSSPSEEAAFAVMLGQLTQVAGLAVAVTRCLALQRRRDIPTAIRVVLLGTVVLFLTLIVRM